jgi:dTDP-4-amino-4,6-dideoxygalactose transaminase
MDAIMEIAKRHNLLVIEDAAQGLMATYKGKALGTIGHLGTISLHEPKNITAGEGGALLINDDRFIDRAEIIREKGTNRSRFFRGQVAKYTWVDIGSSYLPGELIAAFLLAQMEEAEQITNRRLELWGKYHQELETAECKGIIRRPTVPVHCAHNAHMYYVIMASLEQRTSVMKRLKEQNIHLVFHYVPLHTSPAGERYCRTHGDMTVTNDVSGRLVRLPLWLGLEYQQQEYIVRSILQELC